MGTLPILLKLYRCSDLGLKMFMNVVYDHMIIFCVAVSMCELGHFGPSMLGVHIPFKVCAQLFLQFCTDLYETLQVCFCHGLKCVCVFIYS